MIVTTSSPLADSSSPASPESETPIIDDLGTNQKASARARRAGLVRAASKRRRFIDPATCERDYTEAELEFMKAIQAYKLKTGKPFPSWGEVLGVIRELGYEKSNTSSAKS